MAERTYLFSYGDGPWGASPTRRTRAEIEAHSRFKQVHPVLMHRLFQLADAVIDEGGDYGFGGGWRSSYDQMITFTSRYDRVDYWTSLYWDGSPSWPEKAGYYVHARMAPSAPPGRSYHESTTSNGGGFALAVDMVGDHRIGNRLAPLFGLKHFGDVNGEPWHYQPIEIPNARRNYAGQFENVVLPAEPTEDDFMSGWTLVPGGTRVYDSRNDILGPFKPGEVRKVPVALGSQASIAGATQGPVDGWWSYRPDTDFSGNITSFSNTPNGAKRWSNWGAIQVVCPGGHIYVKSLYGGHIYIDTYAFRS